MLVKGRGRGQAQQYGVTEAWPESSERQHPGRNIRRVIGLAKKAEDAEAWPKNSKRPVNNEPHMPGPVIGRDRILAQPKGEAEACPKSIMSSIPAKK